MSILQTLMTAPLLNSSGSTNITWNSITYSSVNEGQENAVYLNFENWDNTTVYWYLVDAGNNQINSGQLSSANSGTFNPGQGAWGIYGFNFTFANDSTTDGSLEYYVRIENANGDLLVPRQGAYTVNDTSFVIGGSLSLNGSTFNWATTNATSPTYATYTYPDNSSGSVHTLTGTQYVLSPQFGVSPTLNFNLWFYPTANNTIVLGELGQTTESSDWHLSMLEINSSNKLRGRVWEMTSGLAVTSTGSVNLNAWNHVYFYYNPGTTTFGMSLNNETAVTQGSVSRHTSDTGHTYWGIGLYDPGTNMGSGARYQGKFDGLVIDTTLVGSNYTATKSKYNQVTLTSGEALGFNGSDNRHVIVADNLADWNLGNNWTIEWWQKIPASAGTGGYLSVLCQDANVPTFSGIDVFVNNGAINMFNGYRQMSEATAIRDQWNHIALQNNGGTLTGYINGLEQTFNGSHSGTIAPSSPLNVCIGSRTYDGGANFYGQYFNGQLANIRISSIARYSTTFTPPTTVEVDQYTKLSLDGSLAGGDGMLTDELARHTITNNGATIVTIT